MAPQLDSSLKQKFDLNGYLVIEDFLTPQEVDEMKKEMGKIVDEMDPSKHPKSIFTTDDPDRHVQDNYFLDSVDKIRFFYEEGAFNKNGELVVDKQRALNKVGHGLHWLNPVFKKVTFSDRVRKLVDILGFQDPVVPQGMYIFKQPKIGGSVTGHMDATFLIGEPVDRVFGLWFALDDATEENGCLWFIPGSHKGVPVSRKFVRTHQTDGPLLKHLGADEPRDESKLVAAPAKQGSCVVIHGLVWHKSEANLSDKSRHAYTFHIFDQGTSKWSKDAWLQPTSEYPFPRLNGEKA
jgi:ectoine hydroxylase-related dioxygenase (phytanoyl-CoA dioxygenase family)